MTLLALHNGIDLTAYNKLGKSKTLMIGTWTPKDAENIKALKDFVQLDQFDDIRAIIQSGRAVSLVGVPRQAPGGGMSTEGKIKDLIKQTKEALGGLGNFTFQSTEGNMMGKNKTNAFVVELTRKFSPSEVAEITGEKLVNKHTLVIQIDFDRNTKKEANATYWLDQGNFITFGGPSKKYKQHNLDEMIKAAKFLMSKQDQAIKVLYKSGYANYGR